MNEKEKSKFSKILKKIEDKGFYIILSLCIAAIGVSGYVLFVNNETETYLSEDPDSIWSADSLFDGTEPPDIPEEDYVPKAPEVDLETISNEENEEEKAAETVSDLPKAMLPTEGEVTKGYSGNELLYDETMCDYRTHNGTDFACTQGDSIFCMRDGRVEDVYEDGLYGWTVKLKHDGGITTTYSGLSSGLSLKAGDEVKMGDPVGTAGGTAIGETNEPYHVHISAQKDGAYIDIMSLFE